MGYSSAGIPYPEFSRGFQPGPRGFTPHPSSHIRAGPGAHVQPSGESFTGHSSMHPEHSTGSFHDHPPYQQYPFPPNYDPTGQQFSSPYYSEGPDQHQHPPGPMGYFPWNPYPMQHSQARYSRAGPHQALDPTMRDDMAEHSVEQQVRQLDDEAIDFLTNPPYP
jgi:hypothetical protein